MLGDRAIEQKIFGRRLVAWRVGPPPAGQPAQPAHGEAGSVIVRNRGGRVGDHAWAALKGTVRETIWVPLGAGIGMVVVPGSGASYHCGYSGTFRPVALLRPLHGHDPGTLAMRFHSVESWSRPSAVHARANFLRRDADANIKDFGTFT